MCSSFGFNLLSVSQLTRDIGCCVFFLAGLCYIQDPYSWKTIGLVEQIGGLYHLLPRSDNYNVTSKKCPSSVHTCCIVSSNNLWHYRLGHIPLSMLKILQIHNFANTFSNSSPREIRHLAKQKKLPFHSS